MNKLIIALGLAVGMLFASGAFAGDQTRIRSKDQTKNTYQTGTQDRTRTRDQQTSQTKDKTQTRDRVKEDSFKTTK